MRPGEPQFLSGHISTWAVPEQDITQAARLFPSPDGPPLPGGTGSHRRNPRERGPSLGPSPRAPSWLCAAPWFMFLAFGGPSPLRTGTLQITRLRMGTASPTRASLGEKYLERASLDLEDCIKSPHLRAVLPPLSSPASSFPNSDPLADEPPKIARRLPTLCEADT